MTGAEVVARSLRVVYGSTVALADSDFEIASGTVTALIGPNGSGKTTLLHAIAGIAAPKGGELRRASRDVATVFQISPAVETLPLTVRETVTMGRYGRGRWLRRLDAADRDAIERAMERLEVRALADRQLRELSGGERQRVLVAQGLAQEADLLLLDEPITGLDLVSRDRILHAIDDERAAGHTVVVSTHDLRDAKRADQVILLAGRVVAAGPPQEVLDESRLAEAYGTRLVRLGAGALFLDEEHHHHGPHWH
jgi:ABC-type Mn2+/Zn2+ transport system ATPase subunit